MEAGRLALPPVSMTRSRGAPPAYGAKFDDAVHGGNSQQLSSRKSVNFAEEKHKRKKVR